MLPRLLVKGETIIPVLVLDASPEAVTELRERVARLLAKEFNAFNHMQAVHEAFYPEADEILKLLNLPAGKGRKT